tara:strand:+ start:6139 stop:6936 length:798 start_codon:yes stop_codon:yes gene_type:complete
MIKTVPQVMTIAGSDSGGGAGIQADIKTLNSISVYGSSVITCVTAQNSKSVNEIFRIPDKTIENQINTVMSDFKIKNIKLGMLYDSKIMKVVIKTLNNYKNLQIVSDPVMISKSGDHLLKESAINFYKKNILPYCYLITPNIHEVNKLFNCKITNEENLLKYIKKIYEQSSINILVKGGHLSKTKYSNDYLIFNNKIYKYESKRYNTINTHGTGCTLSAAISGYLAKNYSLPNAVKKAKEFVSIGIKKSLDIGSGCGPLNHFPRS